MPCETLRDSTSEQFWQFVPKDRKSSKDLFSYDVEIEHLIAIDDSGPQCRGKRFRDGLLENWREQQRHRLDGLFSRTRLYEIDSPPSILSWPWKLGRDFA